MNARRTALATLAIVALALVGCTSTPSQPSDSPAASADPGASASPDVSPDPSPVAIPSDCRGLISPDVYDATFGDTPLNDPAVLPPDEAGVVQPAVSPVGATPSSILASAVQLRCAWKDPRADISHVLVTVATVDASVGLQYLDELSTEGRTCGEAHGGRRCQLIQPNEQYGVDEGYTDFLRGDVFISVGQANFPTNDLLGSIVTTMWG